jgi:hypothetical protein
MRHSRRVSPGAERYAERKQREDEAPRLSTQVAELVSLRLDIVDQPSGGGPQIKYARKIVIENAPALFLLPCGDPRCTDSGHDITHAVMRALHNHETEFKGDDPCTGTLGLGTCNRILHFKGEAEYKTE